MRYELLTDKPGYGRQGQVIEMSERRAEYLVLAGAVRPTPTLAIAPPNDPVESDLRFASDAAGFSVKRHVERLEGPRAREDGAAETGIDDPATAPKRRVRRTPGTEG